jgi:hypothetical protein
MREERRAEQTEEHKTHERQSVERQSVEHQSVEQQSVEQEVDAAEAGRRARFGALPERVNPQDLVEERPAIPRDPARDDYDPDQVAIRYGL